MKMSEDNKRSIVKNLLIILAVIIVSVLLVRFLTSGETLAEAAQENNFPIHSTQ